MTAAVDVVICDGSDIARQRIASALKELIGCNHIGDASIGSSAVEQVVRLAPHLVLLDVRMFEMKASAALRKIKQALPKCKLIIFTDMDDDATVTDSLAAGADSFCLKNRPSLLPHAIQATLEGATWLDPSVGMRMVRRREGLKNVERRDLGPVEARVVEKRFRLSRREYDVLGLMAQGCSNKEIAAKLWISAETVKTHVGNIMTKLEVSDRTQASLKALREQLI